VKTCGDADAAGQAHFARHSPHRSRPTAAAHLLLAGHAVGWRNLYFLGGHFRLWRRWGRERPLASPLLFCASSPTTPPPPTLHITCHYPPPADLCSDRRTALQRGRRQASRDERLADMDYGRANPSTGEDLSSSMVLVARIAPGWQTPGAADVEEPPPRLARHSFVSLGYAAPRQLFYLTR